MSDKFDVIVVGAGLGGLECAYMLAKHGKKVAVLEQGALLGGCLQTFRRNGVAFDTGFHYVGGLEDGQMLHRLFGFFNLLDLPWVKMDSDCFDEVVVDGERFAFANGYDHFADVMTSRFPGQKDNICNYVSLLKEVGDNISRSFDPRSAVDVYQQSLFAKSAYDFLSGTITDPKLVDVLSGTSLKMELCADKLPLYVFAQINSSFIQSAYRISGGGMQIAESLRRSIEGMGGVVLRNSKVTAFEGSNGKASAVIVNNGEARFEADTFISNAHPAVTVDLLQEAGLVRKIYQKRISNLENTFGMFTVNVALKPGSVLYRNNNVYAYKQSGVWDLHRNLDDGVKAVLVSYAPPSDGSVYARNLDLLTPMNWSAVSRWFGTKVGCRGDDYEQFKQNVAKECIDFACKSIDDLAGNIEDYWISTPLTYADYTSSVEGSAYGIRKDYNAAMYTVLAPKTPVSNVFLTGQNLNLHGVLGTSMTAMFTCAEILGMSAVVEDLKSYN